MSNVTYLSGWKPELCIQLDTVNNELCDFNRTLFKGIPSTQHIQHGKPTLFANRERFIFQIKNRFVEEVEEGKSHNTLYHTFNELYQYLQFCDNRSFEAFTQQSLEEYMTSQLEHVRSGHIKNSTYSNRLSKINTICTNYLDLPTSWFLSIPAIGKSDTESFEAYSRSDLNQLLPFLRQLFNQTSEQFIENPHRHIDAHKSRPTMVFHWKGQDYKLCGAISKMMCAAGYLLSYYTYSNTTVLLI